MTQCYQPFKHVFRTLYRHSMLNVTNYSSQLNIPTTASIYYNCIRGLSKYPASVAANSQAQLRNAQALRPPCEATHLCRGLHSTQQRWIEEDKHTKAVAVWSNLRALKASPLPALTLGLSGLIPFIAAPAYMISTGAYMPDVAFAQLAYGASILSFLGGVRWGFVLPEENPVQPNWINLGYSVTPSLIAWLGLLMPHPAGILSITAGLGFAAYADMAMYGYPRWFKGMRFLLSFIAILSLWSTFMCSFVMSRKSDSANIIEPEVD